jgi:hypothetical protein
VTEGKIPPIWYALVVLREPEGMRMGSMSLFNFSYEIWEFCMSEIISGFQGEKTLPNPHFNAESSNKRANPGDFIVWKFSFSIEGFDRRELSELL